MSPTSGLNPQEIVWLGQASDVAAAAAFTSASAAFANGGWLAAGNRYLHDCVGTLKSDEDLRTPPVDRDLREYIAVSACLHCFDGWCLLGRSLDCVNRGDLSPAVVLAYYAELRAAISLLAFSGVGVLEDRHFVIDGAGHCSRNPPRRHRAPLRTHTIAWLALEHWGSLRCARDLLRETIVPFGVALGVWFDALGIGTLSGAMAAKWMRCWGLDLQLLADGMDRNARNAASYRPGTLNCVPAVNPLECYELLEGLWRCLEPGAEGAFAILDRHLLRSAIRDVRRGSPAADRTMDARIDSAVDALLVAGTITDAAKSFLKGLSVPSDPLPIAKAQVSVTTPECMTSRALLLLRVATGASSTLFRQVRDIRNKTAFWWEQLGVARGLWDPGKEPTQMSELWDDVELAIGRMQAASHGAGGSCLCELKRSPDNGVTTLGEFERVAMWGLGL